MCRTCYSTFMNKKERLEFVPDMTLDLHGLDHAKVKKAMKDLKSKYKENTKLRIIVKAAGSSYSSSPLVAPLAVKRLLEEQDISWNYAKQQNGGDGAIECTL